MKVLNINDIKRLQCPTAVTVGMFDGVHRGHRSLVAHLLRLAAQRELEPVVVTFDRHPRQVLTPDDAPQLLTTTDERLALLEECGVPTVVMVPFDEATAAMSACCFAEQVLCERLDMRLLVLGYDNQFGSRSNNDFGRLPALAAERGFAMERDAVLHVEGVAVSSTQIRKALLAGDVRRAAAMLGAPYGLSGVVEHGRHVGSSMGFPTANIGLCDPCKLLPASGVYAMRVAVDGHQVAAMGNLGAQPTFGQQAPALEVHLLGYEGDLYGRRLRVEFLDRLRDIRVFDGADQLADQLRRDRERVLQLMDDEGRRERLTQ